VVYSSFLGKFARIFAKVVLLEHAIREIKMDFLAKELNNSEQRSR